MADDIDLGISGLSSPRSLGRDGPASVFAAADSGGAPVVVKLFSLTRGAEGRAAADLQLDALAKLRDCPGVVPVVAHGSNAMGVPYVVSPAVDGVTASSLIARGVGLGWERASELVAAAAAGLDHAHRRGVVHGGVRPTSILEGASGQVFVSDFGAASVAAQLGLANWVAPEVADGPATPESDVFGLGASLAGLIIGRSPFDTDDDGRRISTDMTDYGAPEAVAEVVTIAMARDPEHRQPTASAFRSDLLSAMTGHTSYERDVLPPVVLGASALQTNAPDCPAASAAATIGSAKGAATADPDNKAAAAAPSENRRPTPEAPAAPAATSSQETPTRETDKSAPASDATAASKPGATPMLERSSPAGAVPGASKSPAGEKAGDMQGAPPTSKTATRPEPKPKPEPKSDSETAVIETAAAGTGRRRAALLLVPLLLVGLIWGGLALRPDPDASPGTPTDTTTNTGTDEAPADQQGDDPEQQPTEEPVPTAADLVAAPTCPTGMEGPLDGLCSETVPQISGEITYSCPNGGELVAEECVTAGAETFVPGTYLAGSLGRPAVTAQCPGGYSFNGGTCVGSVSSATVSVCPGAAGIGAVVSVDGQSCTVAATPGVPGTAATSATCDGVATAEPAEACGRPEFEADIVVPATTETAPDSCPAGFEGPQNRLCTRTVEAS